jgi:hypothetical protein
MFRLKKQAEKMDYKPDEQGLCLLPLNEIHAKVRSRKKQILYILPMS